MIAVRDSLWGCIPIEWVPQYKGMHPHVVPVSGKTSHTWEDLLYMGEGQGWMEWVGVCMGGNKKGDWLGEVVV